MKKFLLTAAVVTYTLNAAAQNTEIINADVQKSLDQTQAAMQKSVEQMDRQMQKVMPVVAESMAQMMQDFFQTIPPLMKSIEENQVLSKAAAQMNREIETQVNEVNANLKDFKSFQEQKSTAGQDKFMVSGSKNDNGRQLDFSYSQNDGRLAELQKAFRAKTAPDGNNDFSLTDLNNQKLKGRDFKLEFIDGRNYLIYDDGNNYCFITGIAENDIIVRVLTTGADAPERARNFIKNVRNKIGEAS